MTNQPPVDGRRGALCAHTFQLAQLLKSADKALVLAHLDELLNAEPFEKHGRLWVSYPVADWHEQHFTWMGQSKIIRLLDSLAEDDKLLIRTKERLFESRPKYDRTWGYSLDYEALGKLLQVTPESLKTKRNKRLPVDDPNRVLPPKVTLAGAAIRVKDEPTPAPTPEDRPPRLKLSNFGGENETPPRDAKYHAYPGGGHDLQLWDSEYGLIASEVSDYMRALEWTKGGKRRETVHPRSIPNMTGYIGSVPVELHVPHTFNDEGKLQNAVASHFGYKRQGAKWVRKAPRGSR